MKKILLSFIFFYLTGIFSPSYAEGKKAVNSVGNKPHSAAAAIPPAERSSNGLINPLVWISKKGIKVFMGFFSKYDGPRCLHSPTCSLYTLRAIDKYGFLRGWAMGSARRMRCSPYTFQWDLPVEGNRFLDTLETTSLWSEKERRKITPLSP